MIEEIGLVHIVLRCFKYLTSSFFIKSRHELKFAWRICKFHWKMFLKEKTLTPKPGYLKNLSGSLPIEKFLDWIKWKGPRYHFHFFNSLLSIYFLRKYCAVHKCTFLVRQPLHEYRGRLKLDFCPVGLGESRAVVWRARVIPFGGDGRLQDLEVEWRLTTQFYPVVKPPNLVGLWISEVFGGTLDLKSSLLY